MGLLAPAGITARLDGDESLRKRPMARVIEPLRAMGADISGEKLPIKISPALMHSADIVGKVASAQVKSAILLAGMQLPDVTSYTEPLLTRNHTERMMPMFGVEIRKEGNTSYVGGGKIEPCELTVPGDISSAAMLIAAAYIYGNSEITVRQVGLNPTRTAFIDILKSWGADIARDSALCGDIIVKSSALSGGEISGSMSAYAIDELPLLAALGLFTDNGVVIKDAAELRHKECDRISAMVHNLRLLGAEVEEFDDGLAVSPLKDGKSGVLFDSMGDHRIAMINIMLAKRWEGGINSDDLAALKVSFPTFINELERLEIK
jgi:3-phosphoshikimate 1-carboxyvinyltransferase